MDPPCTSGPKASTGSKGCNTPLPLWESSIHAGIVLLFPSQDLVYLITDFDNADDECSKYEDCNHFDDYDADASALAEMDCAIEQEAFTMQF